MTKEDGFWAVFQIEQHRYCLPGEALEAIVIPELLTGIPGLPSYCGGLLEYRKKMLPILDMRLLLNFPGLEQRVEDFAQMKEMHISWVDSLRKSVAAKTIFTEAVDPHLCKFGKWYDRFQTDDFTLNHILKQLARPHAQIHFCGARVNELLKNGENAAGPLAEAEALCQNEIVPLLDRLIAAYRDANRGVALIVNAGGRQAGLLVDRADGLLPKERGVLKELPRACAYYHSVVQAETAVSICIDVERLPFLQIQDVRFSPAPG